MLGVIILVHRNYVILKIGENMKSFVAIVATLFAVTAFAAEPAKKEEKKPEAKPAAVAPAKEEKKCDPAKDKDCKPAVKKDEKKAAEPAKK